MTNMGPDREQRVAEVVDRLERDMTLIGASAIEDKLQDEVGETIQHVKLAGVKLWVLTGDKIETAINIGFACKLLDNDMELFILDKTSTKEIYR